MSTIALCALIELLAIFGIAARASPQKWLHFVPLSALILYQIFCTTIVIDGNPVSTHGIGIRLFSLLGIAFDYIVIKDAHRDIRRVDSEGKDMDMGIEKAPLTSRLWRAAALLYNARAVGWTHEPPKGRLPPKRTFPSYGAFLASQTAYLLKCMLVYDAAITLLGMNPYFNSTLTPADITGYAKLWRLAEPIFFVVVYAWLSMEYTALSVVWVGVGIAKPQDWPRLFNSPSTAYTIRRFWGTMWHQLFRLVFSAQADFLAKTLNFPKKSKFTTYFKLFVIFFLSGVMHHVGDYTIFHSWTEPRVIVFFLLHAFAIMVEDGVLALAKRAGLRESQLTRTLGCVYVWVLLAYTLPYWLDPEVPIGYFDAWPRFGILKGFGQMLGFTVLS